MQGGPKSEYFAVTRKSVVVSCTVRLAIILLKDEESARVLVGLTAKYSPILFFFADSRSKPFSIWLLITLPMPPYLKYVATLPCNLSLIACLLTLVFHKVVWQQCKEWCGC